MSQRHRRQQRRWVANMETYYRYFVKETHRYERKERGWLAGPDPEWCGAPYHQFAHRKLIHKGRKP